MKKVNVHEIQYNIQIILHYSPYFAFLTNFTTSNKEFNYANLQPRSFGHQSFYIYNLHFSEQKIYGHQVRIYLNVPGIPVRIPLQNRPINS